MTVDDQTKNKKVIKGQTSELSIINNQKPTNQILQNVGTKWHKLPSTWSYKTKLDFNAIMQPGISSNNKLDKFFRKFEKK